MKEFELKCKHYLEAHIKGKISCTLSDTNTISIMIQTRDVIFGYTVQNVSDLIIYNLQPYDDLNLVIKEFEKFILSLYLKTE